MWLTLLGTFIGIGFLVRNFINKRVKEAHIREDKIIDHNISLGIPMSVEHSGGRVKITAVPIPSPVPSPDPAGKKPAGKPPQPPLGADSC